MGIVYLNGEFLPQEQAKISVMDRGFLFADGIYEVFPVFKGNIFLIDQHLKRMDRSLAAIDLKIKLDHQQLKSVFSKLLSENKKQDDDATIYLQITRGAESTRNHAIPTNTTPTIVTFCLPPKSKHYELSSEGFSAITLEDTRRRDNFIKAIALLPNVLLYQQAQQQGAVEAILLRDGNAVEGTSSNLFIVKDGVIMTPPLTPMILGGITRQMIIDLAIQHKIPCQETTISETMLRDADEIWLTGSSKEICPITLLDNQPVDDGQIGPVWKKIQDLYEQHKQKR